MRAPGVSGDREVSKEREKPGGQRERTANDARVEAGLSWRHRRPLPSRDHPPRPWAEDVVCALGAGWNLRGVRNHDFGHRLGSDFGPVLTIEPTRTG